MMKTMVAAIFLAVFSSPLFAQDPPLAASTRGGCGPSKAQFDVKTNNKQHLVASPVAGKAIVYVFEDMNAGPTMRVGLDGAWIGANKGKSYFFFSVDTGEHQVCTNWQSRASTYAARFGSALTLKAEAGKIYYLRMQFYERTERDRDVKFEPVEAAEGQFLISASAFSTSHLKK